MSRDGKGFAITVAHDPANAKKPPATLVQF
jgi:hypothetical protein